MLTKVYSFNGTLLSLVLLSSRTYDTGPLQILVPVFTVLCQLRRKILPNREWSQLEQVLLRNVKSSEKLRKLKSPRVGGVPKRGSYCWTLLPGDLHRAIAETRQSFSCLSWKRWALWVILSQPNGGPHGSALCIIPLFTSSHPAKGICPSLKWHFSLLTLLV